MRKFALFVQILIILVCFLGVLPSVQAGIITFDSATTNSDVSRTWLNNTFYKVYNCVNGGLDTNNLASNAVTADDIATAANPLVRDNELIGEMIYSGLTIPTSATLASTTTAGVAYIANDSENKLYRVVTDATSKTYTASKDTWVYLNYLGAFSYTEQALGAAQPATPANSILIAKVTTDATTVASVIDYRQTSPTNLRIYSDFRQGGRVSYDTAATIVIDKGEIEFGSGASIGKRRNTSAITLTWADIDAGAEAGSTYYYVWAYPSASNSTNFAGKISTSSTACAGVSDERLVGWFWNDESSNVSADSVGSYKGDGSGVTNMVGRSTTDEISTTSSSFVTCGGTNVKFYSSGRPVWIGWKINSVGSTNSYGPHFQLNIDGTRYASTNCSSNVANAYADNWVLWGSVAGMWKGRLEPGTHDIKIDYRAATGNTVYAISRDIVICEE